MEDSFGCGSRVALRALKQDIPVVLPYSAIVRKSCKKHVSPMLREGGACCSAIVTFAVVGDLDTCSFPRGRLLLMTMSARRHDVGSPFETKRSEGWKEGLSQVAEVPVVV
jgi:hypothetical protein